MESTIHVADLIERLRPLKRFCEWLRDHPLFVIPLFLGVYGFALIDRGDFGVMSAAPLQLHIDPRRQFIHSSPLTYFLGYPLTVTVGSAWSYAVVMSGGLGLALFALTRLVASRYGPRQNDAMLMFFATPLLIVLSQFIGKPDAYFVAFLLLLATVANPAAQVALACLVVLSHFEMGLVVLGSALLLRIVPRPTTMVGALAGAALMLGYLYYFLPSPPQSRAAVGLELLASSVEAVISTPILHLVFTFGPFWLCVLAARPSGWRWLAALFGTALVSSVTLDFTRVFVLVGLPMIISVVDQIALRTDGGGTVEATPRWFKVLPLCAFVQAHLLGQLVFDSRVPKLVLRLLE